MKKNTMKLAAAAMSGLFAGSIGYAAKTTKTTPADANKPGTTTNTVVSSTKCEGVNSCKGKGACKSATNDNCAGHNGCKAKGVMMTTSAEECTKLGGKVQTSKL